MIADTFTTPSLEQLTDEELMRQVIGGSQEAFEVVVQRYQALIFNYTLRALGGDYELAEDITQNVFLQLHITHPIPTSEYGSLKSWLLHVVSNRCKDVLRKWQRYKRPILFSELRIGRTDTYTGDTHSPLISFPDSGASPEEILERQDLHEALEKAINALPQKYRDVVRLRYAQLPYSEIEQKLKMPENTAKTYYQRARLRLRIALADHV